MCDPPAVSRSSLASALPLGLALSCGGDPEPTGPLHLPTGAALSPEGGWLFIANSDLDRRRGASTLLAVDLATLDDEVRDPAPAGTDFGANARCRDSAVQPGVVECDVAEFINDAATLSLPVGAGNIVVDRPFGDDGIARLLIPSTVDQTVTWIDAEVTPEGPDQDRGELELRCGQDRSGTCDEAHTLTHRFNDPDSTRLPKDGARLSLADGYRYAYLPHLSGSVMTLIDLSGDGGPEISDIEGDFFNTDPYTDTEYAGGFAVAQRPCDPAHPPSLSLECTRPALMVTHRFWPGIRQFTIATAADVLLGNNNRGFQESNPATSDDLPYMGDLAFEDGTGDRLLMVSTTPPALLRIDTRLDEEDEPNLTAIDTVGLCRNPNILAIDRPPTGEALAYVSCYSDAQIAVVGLGSFRLVKTIDVGEGPNELVIDTERRRLYVVETLGHAVAVIDTDATSSRYLQVTARIGVGDGFF